MESVKNQNPMEKSRMVTPLLWREGRLTLPREALVGMTKTSRREIFCLFCLFQH